MYGVWRIMYVWGMVYDVCMGYVWGMYDVCMRYVWGMYDVCMMYVWGMYEHESSQLGFGVYSWLQLVDLVCRHDMSEVYET